MKQLILKYSFFLFILTYGFKTIGQNESCISSDVRVGCAPFTVSIINCSVLNNSSTRYQYEPGITKTTDLFHTYNSAGLFSVRQEISEVLPGDIENPHDSLFVDFFRVVSTPEIVADIISCKNKEAFITIDSSTYDFYLIKNSLNNDIDTIRIKGQLIKKFTNSLTSDVTFTISGEYNNLDCGGRPTDYSITLIDKILPSSISTINEFQNIQVEQISIENVNYILKTSNNNIAIDSIAFINQNIFSISPTTDYDKIILEAKDFCDNVEPYLEVSSFKSQTSFDNNQNTIQYISGGVIDGHEQYLKYNTDTTILNSNIDNNIICGSNDCYLIKNSNSFGAYTFDHFSTGNCDTSFSIDKPTPAILKIDNSNDSTSITLLNSNEINFITLNDEKIELKNNKLTIPYTTTCFNLSQTNLCDQTSNVEEYCPILLDDTGIDLQWNEEINESYALAWLSIDDDTTFFETSVTSNYPFGVSQYFAQEFCVIVISNETGSISNKRCYEDQSFLFIPELIYKKDILLNLKQKYLTSFKLDLYDLNGNLILEWNENSTLTTESLDTGTYFYIFEGSSENGTSINEKGSILLKD